MPQPGRVAGGAHSHHEEGANAEEQIQKIINKNCKNSHKILNISNVICGLQVVDKIRKVGNNIDDKYK